MRGHHLPSLTVPSIVCWLNVVNLYPRLLQGLERVTLIGVACLEKVQVGVV